MRALECPLNKRNNGLLQTEKLREGCDLFSRDHTVQRERLTLEHSGNATREKNPKKQKTEE